MLLGSLHFILKYPYTVHCIFYFLQFVFLTCMIGTLSGITMLLLF